jgi:hypothetical protein
VSPEGAERLLEVLTRLSAWTCSHTADGGRSSSPLARTAWSVNSLITGPRSESKTLLSPDGRAGSRWRCSSGRRLRPTTAFAACLSATTSHGWLITRDGAATVTFQPVRSAGWTSSTSNASTALRLAAVTVLPFRARPARADSIAARPIRPLVANVRAHLVNPVVRRLLRPRAHRLLSGSVLLLEYTGRRSGVRHELPAMFTSVGDCLIVIAGQPGTKT